MVLAMAMSRRLYLLSSSPTFRKSQLFLILSDVGTLRPFRSLESPPILLLIGYGNPVCTSSEHYSLPAAFLIITHYDLANSSLLCDSLINYYQNPSDENEATRLQQPCTPKYHCHSSEAPNPAPIRSIVFLETPFHKILPQDTTLTE